MKKKIINICLIIFIILVSLLMLSFFGFVYKVTDTMEMSSFVHKVTDIIKMSSDDANILYELYSPDREHVAYIFENNTGATSPFIYRLSIKKSNEEANLTKGNTYISYDNFNGYWIDNSTFKVENTTTENIFKQKKKINNIVVLYNYEK